MRFLPAPGARVGELPYLRGFVERVLGKADSAEPVSVWREAPEAELLDLTLPDKQAYLAALLPLVRDGRKLRRPNLRRLYQLFAFMEMPAAARLELLDALGQGPRAAPEAVPFFRNPRLRLSLAEEAEFFASNAPSRVALEYADLLRVRLRVKRRNSRNVVRLLEKLTDIENRAATLLGKRGHIVRLDERRLEVFKKSLAAIGVPSAVLFPLGTLGLSAEGITTGLVALGGGFILPAGIAMLTGLGVAVALGITSKKLLDMMMPTVDADRASVEFQQFSSGIIELQRLLDEVTNDHADSALTEHARARITQIMQRIAPFTVNQRTRIEAALNRARILGDRYLSSLEHDRTAVQHRHPAFAQQLKDLLELDSPGLITV